MYYTNALFIDSGQLFALLLVVLEEVENSYSFYRVAALYFVTVNDNC